MVGAPKGGLRYRAIEFAHVVLLALILLDLAIMMTRLSPWIIPAALLGWLAADFGSGLAHIALDYRRLPAGKGFDRLLEGEFTRGTAEFKALRRQVFASTGLIDQIAYDFQTHHLQPMTLGRRPFLDLTYLPVLLFALPGLALFNLCLLIWPLPGWLIAFMLADTIGLALAQYLHSCAHRPMAPPIVRIMQRLRLAIPGPTHGRHHADFDDWFPIMCGWSNFMVRPIFALLVRRGWVERTTRPAKAIVPAHSLRT